MATLSLAQALAARAAQAAPQQQQLLPPPVPSVATTSNSTLAVLGMCAGLFAVLLNLWLCPQTDLSQTPNLTLSEYVTAPPFAPPMAAADNLGMQMHIIPSSVAEEEHQVQPGSQIIHSSSSAANTDMPEMLLQVSPSPTPPPKPAGSHKLSWYQPWSA